MTQPPRTRGGPQQEAELRRLRLAIEASGEIIFTTDLNGTFSYVNPEFERVYGYESTEVVGKATPRLLKGGSTPAEDYLAFWAQLAGQQIVRREFLNRAKDGSFLHIETSANPILDEEGSTVGYLAVQRDITRRTRLERALRDSELRYRTLADAAEDSIFILNADGHIEYHNDVAASRFGVRTAETVGKRLDEVFPPDAAAEMWRQASIVFASRRRELFEHAFATPAGELWLETWLVPLNRDTEVTTVLGVARDITSRKLLERELRQAQKMEAIGLLAGGIAHDFNNLLTAMLGYCEILQEQLQDDPAVVADLGEIAKAGQRAAGLTRQLLAFSRKQPAIPRVLEVGRVLADLKPMLSRLLGENIELSVAAHPDVWPIFADAGQLEQIVLNLAVNARDAMPKGGQLTITAERAELGEAFVRAHAGARAGECTAIAVRDTGCGMGADVLSHAFEPFFTTKPSGRGTGLGLATVYGIVKQNGGYITIDSEVGAGTTVTIFMPKTDKAVAAAESAKPERRLENGSETVLLVEDEAAIRTLMRQTLQRHGYSVLEARDVGDALNISSTHAGTIDLLLTDVIMPGLNGPDLAQRIVARRPTIKILYVSGFPSSLLSRHDGTRRRMAFLAKPFTPQALAHSVRECLDSQFTR